jgi:hypothetical protein
MAMVEYLANAPTCALGYFACSLGGTDANVFAGDDCTLSDIASGVDGVEGDEIASTLAAPLPTSPAPLPTSPPGLRCWGWVGGWDVSVGCGVDWVWVFWPGAFWTQTAKAKVRSAMDGMGNAVRIVEISPRLDASARLETLAARSRYAS